MLAPGADPEQRRSWLAAIAPQISIQAVAPSTIDALAGIGRYRRGPAARPRGRGLRPPLQPDARRRGLLDSRIPRRRPRRRRDVSRGRRRCGVVACHRGERHPLPHRADPPPRSPRRFLRPRVLPDVGGRRDHGGRHGPHLGRRRRRAAHRRRMGRRRLPHARMRARGHRRNADCADARAGARRRIPALHRVLAPDRSQDRRHAARTRSSRSP